MPSCDMEPACLKKHYGDHLAFHDMISSAGPVAGQVQNLL